MAMYKITCKCDQGVEYECTPASPSAPNSGQYFIKYSYTNNEKVADWYRNRIGTISVEEVDESEYKNIAAFYSEYAGKMNAKSMGLL